MSHGKLCTGRLELLSQLMNINYWGNFQFVIVDRRKKIESGQRITSFSWMLNDKRGIIGRMLASVPPQYRESSFMGGQLGKNYFNVEYLIIPSLQYRSICFTDYNPLFHSIPKSTLE